MPTLPFRRPLYDTVLKRLREKRGFIQILSGPRQAGKTTLIRQALEKIPFPSHYGSADGTAPYDKAWLETRWEIGRKLAREAGTQGALLTIDEIQKVTGWSEAVKQFWDEDTRMGLPLRVCLSGSAALQMQSGLSESLAGRFELIRAPHWSFSEMRDAFGWSLERFLFYGSYPGAAELIDDLERWARYIQDSLVETALSRDLLQLTRVDKPALLRQLFRLGCDYTGQVLSYQKMLGQLQDAGNTTTLAHYLELLSSAGLVTGLQKFSLSAVRQRGSSPKFVALNTALVTAQSGRTLEEFRSDSSRWGRLVESAVGAHLLSDPGLEVTWWREANREVDYVVRKGKTVVAIEVTSGRRKDSLPGLDLFGKEFHPKRKLLVGGQGIPLEEFLAAAPSAWVR